MNNGFSPPRACLHAVTFLSGLAIASPALAQPTRIALPATTLDTALPLLARQTGTDIISTEPGLRGVHTRALSGTLTPVAALDRLLKDTGYRAIPVDARSFRVVRARAIARAAPPPPAPRRPPKEDADTPADDVVVTASKQRVPLLRYPGSLAILTPDRWPATTGAPDLTQIAHGTPILQTTELGPGRNKIFIRGIADSSFNGSAQSTATIYLGDVQLGYSGADPSIKLYDMQDVEVMEGPQGTLYGSGSIGGIVRLTPNPVDLHAIHGAVSAGMVATVDGAPGYDTSAMLNVPIVDDRLGVRFVGYHERDGGFIDDPSRHLRAIDGVDTTGGRVAIRAAPGDGWHVDLGALYQQISADDAQYADGPNGGLTRQSRIAQPFDNAVILGSMVVTKDWSSGLQLLSATSIAGYHAIDAFDATTVGAPRARPMIYTTDSAKLLLSTETRLSRSLPNGDSWVVGFTLLRDRDAQSRAQGPVNNPPEIIGVTNVTRSASGFAEATVAATPALAVTVGGRFTLARTDGEPSFRPRVSDFVEGRSTHRIDPTAAVSWKVAPEIALFARAQSGYRTGGLAVARGVGRVADFKSDSIRVGEMGIRKLRTGETGIAFSAAYSIARWRDIQADLVNRRGQPYTANIGDANIQALEGTVDWVPFRGLRATAAFLYTENRVTGPLADLSSPAHRRLPETPPFAAKSDLTYGWRIGEYSALNIGGSVVHVGRSVLGTGDLLDISQGRYTVFGAHAGWTRRRVGISLIADNLTNARGNRFALGNPFALAARDQSTPLRPFNARLGGTFAW